MKEKQFNINFIEYTKDEFESSEYKELIDKSIEVLDNSYSPYSQFKVGASILLENGEIISGTNQENAAYPSGLCAERVAMFYANSKYPEVAVKAIAVSAKYKGKLIDEVIPPCGACRQVLLETEIRFKKPIKLILISENKILVSDNVKQMLPLSFDDNFLK